MLPCGCASSFALFYCWPINSNPNSNCVWALTRSLHFSKVNCNSNSNFNNSNSSNSNFSNNSNFAAFFLYATIYFSSRFSLSFLSCLRQRFAKRFLTLQQSKVFLKWYKNQKKQKNHENVENSLRLLGNCAV